jgi:hypothetical protein
MVEHSRLLKYCITTEQHHALMARKPSVTSTAYGEWQVKVEGNVGFS